MPFELERRWLPRDESWRKLVSTKNYLDITQGYIARENNNAVRIRISTNKSKSESTLCVKGAMTEKGAPEFEYPVKPKDGKALLKLCGNKFLIKRRWFVMVDSLKYEIDEFRGSLEPLVIIELEIKHRNTIVITPTWVGEEVTGQFNYNNAHLVEFGLPNKTNYGEAP